MQHLGKLGLRALLKGGEGDKKFDVLFFTMRCYASAVYVTKMAKPRITQTMPYDSPGTLIFWHQNNLGKFQRDHPQRERQTEMG